MPSSPNAVGPKSPHGSLGRPRRIARLGTAVAALAFASVAAVSMVVARGLYLGYLYDRFLLWNLVLAWIPAAAALLAYRVYLSGRPRGFYFAACTLTWFLFFPNAPYIVTDFVHLVHVPPVPLWFDLLRIAAFAWTGLCLGYLSVYLMQEIVRAQMGRWTSWAFVLVTLLVGSAGIYAGRILRWNSWDVVRDPSGIVRGGLKLVEASDVQLGFAAYVSVTFLFLVATYCATYALTHLRDER